MSRKQTKKTPFSVRDFDEYVQKEVERTGKTKEVIVEETFHDGFITVTETDGVFKIDTSQLFKGDPAKDPLAECRRLRKDFGPVSAAVDYVKDMILGGGIDVFIKNPKDDHQKKLKEELLGWMQLIYQDNYTRKFGEIMNILVDEALTVGYAAAEIVYAEKPKNGSFFDDFAKPITQSVMTKKGEKFIKEDIITYEITEPSWSDLQGISRFKILRDATSRLKLYRTPSWEANYWTLDEPSQTPQDMPLESQIVAQSMGKTAANNRPKPSALFLPWQIFSLALNRREYDEKGISIILPTLSTAQLLEKIMKAVGEGIHRAGNKKFFIICGTEKRPWSAVHIRNFMSQLKEASEKSWSTIPVPSGFDLKEAGGEVFEAENAIDYFLRVLAGSMHVPPSVLGVDFKEIVKSDVPHYTHQRLIEAFKTAIETQAFRLHIWAKFGAKRGKQGGHEDPQYIPEARIKSKALLSEQARLALDIQVLNVANPVRPEMKLEAERDMCALLGWDVLLPTQEEYKAELEKADKEMKAQLAEKAKTQESTQPLVGGEKFQGQPKAPNAETLQKRQEAGVSVRKVDSKKGQSKQMGSTRIVQESEEEQVEESVCEPHKLEITVKTEPQEITVKSEPQIVKTEVTVKTPLDDKLKELAELEFKVQNSQKELVDKETKFAEEENTRKQAKLKADIEQIQTDIKEKNATIEKLKTETEEVKKTHKKKRDLMDEIEKDVRQEEKDMGNQS